MSDIFTVTPIGWVQSPRTSLENDHWGNVISEIIFKKEIFDPASIAGICDFSHLEIVFLMDQVALADIDHGARHPRNQQRWPKVGIFAQRAKNRPNRIGVSRCKLLSVTANTLVVQGLDAIHSTPVLDIKPYMIEFGARGEVHQPSWATELMEHYYA